MISDHFNAGPDEDLELVEQVRAGRFELFHELVRRHEAAIFRGAMAILGNEADAEDAMQETFLRAFRRIGQFRGEARFRTWLIQIAVNVARTKLKETRRERCESLDSAELSGTPAVAREIAEQSASPEEEYSWKELRELMKRVLDGMHPTYRSVLYLRDVENLSTGSTAVALGLTPESVRTRLRRARVHLRDRLATIMATGWK